MKKEEMQMNFCEGVPFVKLHPKAIERMSEKVGMVDFLFFIRLSTLVSYHDCIIRKGGVSNGKVLTCKEIAKILGYDYSYARKIFSSLKRHGLILSCFTKDISKNEKAIKAFIVNPYVMYKGRGVCKWVLDLFKDSGWKEILGNEIDEEYLFSNKNALEGIGFPRRQESKRIYVAEYNGMFKIGVSNNVKKRMLTLACGCPTIKAIYESELLSNAYDIENLLHDIYRCKGVGVGGEWFLKVDIDEIANFIEDYGIVSNS